MEGTNNKPTIKVSYTFPKCGLVQNNQDSNYSDLCIAISISISVLLWNFKNGVAKNELKGFKKKIH